MTPVLASTSRGNLYRKLQFSESKENIIKTHDCAKGAPVQAMLTTKTDRIPSISRHPLLYTTEVLRYLLANT